MMQRAVRLFRRLPRRAPIVLAAALVVFGGLAFAHPAHGIGIFSTPIDQMMIWLSQILLRLVGLVGKLLIIAINQLVVVAQYNDFGNAPAVVQGWVIVRDVANMAFIVFLLIIAFGTILKIENYRYNQLLSRLLLMAVLINFSKLITLFFIDAAQVLMLTFVSAFRDAAAGNLTSAFGLSDTLQFLSTNDSIADVSSGELLTTVVLALALYIIAFIVTLVIVVVLIIRIFALWILIILSPFAYALRAFPDTRSQSTRWWSSFGKYVTTGPTIAFFLWLALTVMAGNKLNQGFNINAVNTSETAAFAISTTTETGTLRAALSDISSGPRLLGFMLSIAFLLTGLQVAQGLGGFAGKIAGDWSERIKRGGMRAARMPFAPAVGAAKLARYGVGALGRKLHTDLAESGTVFGKKFLGGKRMPWITKEYWQEFQQRGKDRRATAMKQTGAAGYETADILAQFMGTGNVALARRLAVEKRDEAHQALIVARDSENRKLLGRDADSQENIVKNMLDAAKLGGRQGEIDRQQVLHHGTAQGHMDDAFNADAVRVHQQLLAAGKKGLETVKRRVFDEKTGKVIEIEGIKQTMENMRRFALTYLRMDADKFMTGSNQQRIEAARNASDVEKENLRILSSMTDATRQVGHAQQAYGLRDEESHEYYIPEEQTMIDKQVSEMKKMSPNEYLPRLVPHMGRTRLVALDMEDEQGHARVFNSNRTEDLDGMQQTLMKELINDAARGELRRIPPRVWKQWFEPFLDENGSVVTEDEEAERRGFTDAQDLQREFHSYFDLSRDGLSALGAHAYLGDHKLIKEFPVQGKSNRHGQVIASHIPYQKLEQEAQAAGYDGMTMGSFRALHDVITDPQYAEAFGQFSQSKIDDWSIRTGANPESVKEELQREAEKSLRKALGGVVKPMATEGDDGSKAQAEFIDRLVGHGKTLTPAVFSDVPPPSVRVAGKDFHLPSQLLGTPETNEALEVSQRVEQLINTLNPEKLVAGIEEVTQQVEESLTQLTDAFHRSADRVSKPVLAQPIDEMAKSFKDELRGMREGGHFDKKETQREYIEHLRRFYRTMTVSLTRALKPSPLPKSQSKK